MEKVGQPGTERLLSIDVLRGVTILVMIFVNDVASVAGTPAWMKHFYPYDADGMTFVDVVFPAFLFIVGMAIPFALGRRLLVESSLQAVRHVFLRTAGLLLIGVYMVNTYTMGMDTAAGRHFWILFSYIGIILAFSPLGSHWRIPWTRIAGFGLLGVLALLYKGNNGEGLVQMRPQWWGIIGLIGWAYLVAGLGWLVARRSQAALVGLIAILYLVFMADQMGAFNNLTAIRQWVNIGPVLGSHAAITLSGVLMGMMLHPASTVSTHKGRIVWAFWFGALLLVSGKLLHTLNDLHPMFIINKNVATPPWCLISSGITVWCWIGVYLLVDVMKVRFWVPIVRPAGENPLFAYILAPMVYSIFALLALVIGFNPHAALGERFYTGFVRAVIFAFAMTWLAGYLRNWGIRPRL
ncbi:MAG: DUF5009 domain-containing protein [Candidatus Sumerlaeia bacterium]|nr:DUF5009 domain-containing protein [Candidatus Sumerlaeia bacterium]